MDPNNDVNTTKAAATDAPISETLQEGDVAAPVYPGVFNFAAAEDDLYEVEVSEEVPDDDDGSTVYSEMDESENEDMLDEGGVDNGPDMAHVVMANHTDSVYVSAVHPTDPAVVVTGGGDDRAFLWRYDLSSADASTESRVVQCIELAGHTDTVTSVGFNYDGSAILTGAYDGTVRTWDSATGGLRLVLDGPEDVEFAQWHSKGNAIVAGSKDGTIWMWLAHDGQCVQVFAGHDGAVSTGTFTSDGKLVCSGGEDGSIRVWAPKTGACKHVFDDKAGHEGLVTCIASSPKDPELLITGKILFSSIIFLILFSSLFYMFSCGYCFSLALR
jgi:angio-associated migratory cell protein